MKIGLFFGSFNPIHIGHLRLAQYIVENQVADETWLVVSPHNPLKEKCDLFDEKTRFELVQTALADFSKLKACDVEFSMPQPSYTLNTLQVLQKQYPQHDFLLLIGSDNAVNFHLWKNYESILRDYKILVYRRRNYDFSTVKTKYPQMQLLDTPYFDVSSTEIRQMLREKNEKVKDFLPKYLFEKVQQLYW